MISVAAKNWSDWERLVLNIRWAYVILFLALNFVNVNATSTMHNSTVNTLRQIDGALEQYQLENHRLPTTAEGLSPVKEFIKGQTVPFDAWEHQFVYRNPGTYETNGFDLYSLGADGISRTGGNDPDDINGWDDHWKRYYSRPELPLWALRVPESFS
jgi:hypothetical protein